VKTNNLQPIPYLGFDGNCAEAMRFSPTFWAKKFGMLIDQFGVAWIINGELTPV